MKKIMFVVIGLWLIAGYGVPTEGRKTSRDARESFSRHFEDKWITVKMALPNASDGLNIVDGRVDEEGLEALIKKHGLAAKAGDELRITKVKVKDRHIEFRFDKDARINILFDRPVTDADLDIDQINEWLSPVIDTTATKKESLSDKLKLN